MFVTNIKFHMKKVLHIEVTRPKQNGFRAGQRPKQNGFRAGQRHNVNMFNKTLQSQEILNRPVFVLEILKSV